MCRDTYFKFVTVQSLYPSIVVLKNLYVMIDKFPSIKSTNIGSEDSIPTSGIPAIIFRRARFTDFSIQDLSFSLHGENILSEKKIH